MVDLNDLEAGDSVIRRDGKEFVVEVVEDEGAVLWPFGVEFNGGGYEFYDRDGSYLDISNPHHQDIVEIIKKEK